ncbi:hypothetical protein [Arthrobacter sp. Bi83]|uniref:hypothetical protein n=1 Tax=Arthrobacter sp. Bi83 TaxID=2822353 RepID=UPI001E320B46|nr:hypothetical protein [Arthrobacter sp. Bi83]
MSGATAPSYSPNPADLGARVSVTITGSKSGYTTLARTSTTTIAVGTGTLTAATPTIAGTPTVGSPLAAVVGTWTAGTTYTYQWRNDGVLLSGATGATYLPVAADFGGKISVTVTGSKTGYISLTRTSASTPAVAAAALTAPVPTVTGTPKVGTTLTAVTGAWGPDPVTLKYQWNADGLAIAGANTPTYALVTGDAGKTITVTVTGTKAGYTSADKTSAPTATVVAAPAGVIRFSGSIDQDTTWSTDEASVFLLDSVTISPGATLLVKPGVVVKGTLTVSGTLKAEGTAVSPVIFTSASDDSAGGDSNGDGPTPTTEQGTPLRVAGIATIVLSHIKVDHSDQLAEYVFDPNGKKPMLQVTDSELNATLNAGDANRPVVERNRIHSRGQAGLSAYRADVSGIALSGPDTNILSGTAQERAVSFGDSSIPVGAAMIWNQDSNASAFSGNAYVEGSLTLTSGVVVKARLTVSGTVKAEGTAAAPVILTSDSDDSAGGDSNGDGATPVTDQVSPLRVESSAGVVLSHVRADNSYMLFDWIFDVSGRQASLQITDSELNTAVNIESSKRPVLERNHIHNRDRGQAGLTTSRVDVSGISLSGSNTNILSGTDVERTVRFHESTIPEGFTETWNQDSNASAFVGDPQVGGNLTLTPGVVFKGVVTVWGTLTAEGTPTAPVIFTSDSDDSAGGDSNGDGATAPFDQGWHIVTAGPATIILSHVRMNHSQQLFNWSNPGQGVTTQITDSELNTAVNIQSWNRPVLERNHIHNGGRGEAGLTAYRVDVSGIALSGPNTNILSGTAAERTVRFLESTIPVGVTEIWNQDANVSAFSGSTYVEGGLTLTAGVVIKARLTVFGMIKAEGTALAPVIFTSESDDSAGGDSNGDGITPITDQYISVRLETGSKASSLRYSLFMHSTTAVSVGEFIGLSVDNSKFVDTKAAFQVDGAAHFDPALSVYYPLLPCAPPYDSMVTVSNTWFGSTGFPGVEADLTSFAGLAIDDALVGGLYDMATGQAPLTGSVGTNTRPWAGYSCSPGDPSKTVSFPVTPVILGSTPKVPAIEPWTSFSQN